MGYAIVIMVKVLGEDSITVPCKQRLYNRAVQERVSMMLNASIARKDNKGAANSE